MVVFISTFTFLERATCLTCFLLLEIALFYTVQMCSGVVDCICTKTVSIIFCSVRRNITAVFSAFGRIGSGCRKLLTGVGHAFFPHAANSHASVCLSVSWSDWSGSVAQLRSVNVYWYTAVLIRPSCVAH